MNRRPPSASRASPARRALHRDLVGRAGRGRAVVLSTPLGAEPLHAASRALVLDRGRLVYNGPADGLGTAVQQRVIFTLNGSGRVELLRLLDGMPGVHRVEPPFGAIPATGAGRAFELLAAVAAAGVRPVEVRVEEPSVDTRLLAQRTVGDAS